jgi:hypothetical protein
LTILSDAATGRTSHAGRSELIFCSIILASSSDCDNLPRRSRSSSRTYCRRSSGKLYALLLLKGRLGRAWRNCSSVGVHAFMIKYPMPIGSTTAAIFFGSDILEADANLDSTRLEYGMDAKFHHRPVCILVFVSSRSWRHPIPICMVCNRRCRSQPCYQKREAQARCP